MQPRSIVFTLYGDYIRYRGGEASVGSLLRLFEPFEVSEAAVRATLSRMSQEGWLSGRRSGRESFYSLSTKSWKMLDEGRARIFEHTDETRRSWSGEWLVLTYSIPEERKAVRDALRKELSWLGFGLLAPATWVTPHERGEALSGLVDTYGLDGQVQILRARAASRDEDRALVARCWYLPRIAERYADFITRYEPLSRRLAVGEQVTDAECYLRRVLLTHEYRKFPFIDPRLPIELLPEDWPGKQASVIFDACYEGLRPGAFAFADDALANSSRVARRKERLAPLERGPWDRVLRNLYR